ncbi:hypothetical protein RJT34_11040 [Clitoria ternatea]|uniref:Uncharacterized protein n=1 Tax=Clitoria ternatea TaxID=43366 RepID=A0AAN9JJR2_CLITE
MPTTLHVEKQPVSFAGLMGPTNLIHQTVIVNQRRNKTGLCGDQSLNETSGFERGSRSEQACEEDIAEKNVKVECIAITRRITSSVSGIDPSPLFWLGSVVSITRVDEEDDPIKESIDVLNTVGISNSVLRLRGVTKLINMDQICRHAFDCHSLVCFGSVDTLAGQFLGGKYIKF